MQNPSVLVKVATRFEGLEAVRSCWPEQRESLVISWI